jgi:hypothetical protein
VKRRLLNLLTALSVLLLLMVAVLWVRSYHYLDDYRRLDRATGRLEDVVLLYGAVQVARVENVDNPDGESGWSWETGWTAMPLGSFGRAPSVDWQVLNNRNVAVRLQFLGFRWLTGNLGPGQPIWSLRIPLWLPAIVFALLPVLRLSRRLRRPGRGRCPG